MKKKILSIVLSFTMVFSTTGFAFADTDLDNSPTEPTKVEKEVEEPPQEKTEKEEVKEEPKEEAKNKEIEKEQPQEENKEEQKTEKIKKEEPITEIKKEEPKKINLSKNSGTKNENTKEESEELTIIFKYIDSNTKQWVEDSLSNPGSSWTVGITKANNKIANHKVITVGLEVTTFTGWDTEFPVVLNQDNPTIIVTAQYETIKKPQLTFKYTDNISTGSGGWQNQSPNKSYTHTFKNPLVASPRTNYTFLYWENIKNSSERYTAGQKYKCNSSTITEDTTVEFVAVYEYQPEVKVLYHYKNGIKDTGAKSKAINIYTDPQAPKSIKHWFYDEEGGEPIQRGELVSLPEKLTPITKEPAAEDKVKVVNVYAHYHGVTFVDENGEDVLKERVEYQYDTDAADIEKPDEPTKEATAQYTYFFNGWMPEIANVIEEVIYKATYRSEVNKYTVTWINEDETTLEVDKNVPYGETPVYNGETPTKKADAQYTYTFKEWSPEIAPVSGNATYKATYTKTLNKYTVTWVNWNNTLLEQDLEVPYGETPSYDGDEPKREKTAQHNYTFIGWDPIVEPVSGNITYVAQYAQDINKFKVTWQNWDETILEIDEGVPYGDKPSYDGETPIKPGTAQFSYEFIGWDPEICEVTDDITYTAQYKEIVNTYTVTWVNHNGNILEKDLEVPYGDTPSYDGATPKKPATSKYTYEFTGWAPTIVKVTGDAIYKATFKAVLIPTPPQPNPSPDQEEPKTVTKTKTKNKTNNNNNNNTAWILGENAGMGDGIEYTPAPTVKVPLSNKEIPFAAPTENGVWALINLLTVLANFVIAIILLLMIYINNRKEDEETEVKNKVFRRICTLIIAIISVIIFLITEDITLPMVLVDKWTILMIIILIINIIITIFSRKKEKEKEEIEEE